MFNGGICWCQSGIETHRNNIFVDELNLSLYIAIGTRQLYSLGHNIFNVFFSFCLCLLLVPLSQFDQSTNSHIVKLWFINQQLSLWSMHMNMYNCTLNNTKCYATSIHRSRQSFVINQFTYCTWYLLYQLNTLFAYSLKNKRTSKRTKGKKE